MIILVLMVAKELEQLPDNGAFGKHCHLAALGGEFRFRVKAQGVINGGRKVGNGHGTIGGDCAMLVTRANHSTGLYTAAAHGKAETAGPMIAARASLVLVDLWSPPKFTRRDDKRCVEHATLIELSLIHI